MFGFGKQLKIPLRVSAAAFDEIADMIGKVDEDGMLDMTGIALMREPDPEPVAVHRPIAGKKKNTAPGAI